MQTKRAYKSKTRHADCNSKSNTRADMRDIITTCPEFLSQWDLVSDEMTFPPTVYEVSLMR